MNDLNNNLKYLLSQNLKNILNELIQTNSLSDNSLNNLLQILYNELKMNFLDLEIKSLLLTILSYYNDILRNKNIKNCNIDFDDKENAFNLNNFSKQTMSQIKGQVTSKNVGAILNTFLVRRNQIK